MNNSQQWNRGISGLADTWPYEVKMEPYRAPRRVRSFEKHLAERKAIQRIRRSTRKKLRRLDALDRELALLQKAVEEMTW